MYTKNPVLVIQDQVRETNESDLILCIPENQSLSHRINGNIGSAVFFGAVKTN